MIIGLDYDNTFTADPEAWREFCRLFRSRGHQIVLVTSRSSQVEFLVEPVTKAVSDVVDGIVFAGHVWKRTAALKSGWKVDVWVDDMPVNIAPQDPEILKVFSES